jgi:hypothetical protein
MTWFGKESYESIDAALQDTEQAVSEMLKDICGE